MFSSSLWICVIDNQYFIEADSQLQAEKDRELIFCANAPETSRINLIPAGFSGRFRIFIKYILLIDGLHTVPVCR